ncbi:MAG: hypothetical protein SGJ10_00290 [Bacteroidota bacterium]|nr:hypothetical protein [Bacteroidota bacterium]
MEPNEQLVIIELEVLLGQYLETYTEASSMNAVKSKIAAHIHDKQGQGIAKLMSFMYLVDVKEELFKDTLQNVPEAEQPNTLAQLVIDRLLQKVYTRLQYRK